VKHGKPTQDVVRKEVEAAASEQIEADKAENPQPIEEQLLALSKKYDHDKFRKGSRGSYNHYVEKVGATSAVITKLKNAMRASKMKELQVVDQMKNLCLIQTSSKCDAITQISSFNTAELFESCRCVDPQMESGSPCVVMLNPLRYVDPVMEEICVWNTIYRIVLNVIDPNIANANDFAQGAQFTAAMVFARSVAKKLKIVHVVTVLVFAKRAT